MYESSYGLRERAFDLTPNPRFLLMTPTHREAIANLQYGMTARKGLTVLIGEAGSGKTTLVCSVLDEWRKAGHLVLHLNNSALTRDEFFEYLAGAFGLPPEAGGSKARFLAEFTRFVTDRHEQGLITGLVIDEAQSLSDALLEEVRLLVNIETASEKLFQVMLVGQPELGDRLNQPGLRQIKQRVALRCTLSPLDLGQVAAYVAGRLQIAGGVAAQVFTREAIMAIARHSAGIPRVISVICDNALLAGFATGRRPVTRDIVEEVCRDFDLPSAAAEPPTPPSTMSGATDTSSILFPDSSLAAAAGRNVPAPDPEPARKEAAARDGLFEHFEAPKRRFSFF